MGTIAAARASERRPAVRRPAAQIFDWYAEDFAGWGGGLLHFLARHLPPNAAAARAAVAAGAAPGYFDYDWGVNKRH